MFCRSNFGCAGPWPVNGYSNSLRVDPVQWHVVGGRNTRGIWQGGLDDSGVFRLLEPGGQRFFWPAPGAVHLDGHFSAGFCGVKLDQTKLLVGKGNLSKHEPTSLRLVVNYHADI